MPGLFGAVGCSDAVSERLRMEFEAVWEACPHRSAGGGLLGAHAHGAREALFRSGEGVTFAVDGEGSLYERAGEGDGSSSALFRVAGEGLELGPACRGNVAAVDRDDVWYLASEWSGSFPLYYRVSDRELLFSSHLRPLARALDAEPDHVGAIEFLLRQYCLGARTIFAGIRRLMPGQTLRFDSKSGRSAIGERSRLWVGVQQGEASRAAVDDSWQELLDATGECAAGFESHRLMMSAGWDSRLVLATMLAARLGGTLGGYTHGDLRGRELRLVRRIHDAVRVPVRCEPIDASTFDVEAIRGAFPRVEDATSPAWTRAARLMSDEGGTPMVWSGAHGEVAGGHYGPAMLLAGRRKILSVAASLGSRPNTPVAVGSARVGELCDLIFPAHPLQRPWYLDAEAWRSIDRVADAIRADIAASLRRLGERGVETEEQLIEAFLGEHRMAQAMNAQIRSCRGLLDIAIPLADRAFLTRASRIPLSAKLQNAYTRLLIDRHYPELLAFPTAATLVAARRPIVAQELFRAVRRVVEELSERAHAASGERLGRLRLGWIDFEFLRVGRELEDLADDLRCDIWDRARIRQLLTRVRAGYHGVSMHSLSDQLGKIYTVDLMMRSEAR